MKRKLKLTEGQELRRIDGLRLLARVIARHYLEHPECYDGNDNYPDGAGGNAAGKEAEE